jgi:hypothetical protein
MDYLQDKYDELNTMITGLKALIDEIRDKYYIEQLEETISQATEELERIEEKLKAEQGQEYQEMNYQYERSVI